MTCGFREDCAIGGLRLGWESNMMHLAAALALLIGPETPQDVGGCAWSHLPQTEQQAVLTAYDRGMSQGMRALSQRDAALQAGVRACANRSDLPLRWSQAAVASHVIQLGASARVARDKGLDRTRLDAAWTDAGDAPRNCALDNAINPSASLGRDAGTGVRAGCFWNVWVYRAPSAQIAWPPSRL